jgi:hypothetical protein
VFKVEQHQSIGVILREMAPLDAMGWGHKALIFNNYEVFSVYAGIGERIIKRFL